MIARSERKAWARERFHGFENVVAPSFSADLRELDAAAVRLDIRQSIRHGVFSSQCAIDAGLSGEEQRRMLSIAVEEAAGKIEISVPLAGDSLAQNVDLLRCAALAGASHAIVGFPASFQPRTQHEVVDYVQSLAESTDLALSLPAGERFSFPQLHPSGVPFAAYERLAELENVVAMQISSADAGLTLECFERLGERLLVTTTSIAMLPMLCAEFAVQWAGTVPIEALQSPEQPHALRFFERLKARRVGEAMAIYWRMAPALGSLMRLAQPPSGGVTHWGLLKYQQWLSGGNGGMTRQPCMRLFERDMQAARAGLRAIGVECPDPDEAFYRGRSAREARS